MNTYEAIVIYSPQLAGDLSQTGKSTFETLLQKQGGRVLNCTDLGKRLLGYTIKKAKEGYAFAFDFELSPDHVEPLKQALQLTEEVLKFTLVRKLMLKAGRVLRTLQPHVPSGGSGYRSS